MDPIIMTFVGVILFIACLVILLENGKPNAKRIGLFLGGFVGVFLYGLGIKNTYIGDPKTSIEGGSYTVEGHVEVLQDKQSYYHLILEQDGGVKLYALPKDMIDAVYQLPEASGKSGILEVVEKSGLRKATLYIPLRK